MGKTIKQCYLSTHQTGLNVVPLTEKIKHNKKNSRLTFLDDFFKYSGPEFVRANIQSLKLFITEKKLNYASNRSFKHLDNTLSVSIK